MGGEAIETEIHARMRCQPEQICLEIEMPRSTTRLKRASLAVLLGAALSMFGALPAPTHELPLQSIIDGHRLQPSEKELSAIDHPDVTASQAAEVDQLYQMLTHCAASECKIQDQSPQQPATCDPAVSSARVRC